MYVNIILKVFTVVFWPYTLQPHQGVEEVHYLVS
jgi:hypothetical protein